MNFKLCTRGCFGHSHLALLSIGCVTDHPREAVLDFEIIRSLGEGAFGHVLLVKKTWTDRQRSREDLFAVKMVPHKFVSEVEREVFVRAVGHPFLVQLFLDFKTEVICSFKQPMNMH